MFKRKHNPRDGFVVTEQEFDRVQTKSAEIDRTARYVFTFVGVLLLAFAYAYVRLTAPGPRVQVENPSSHAVHVSIYCGRFDPNAPVPLIDPNTPAADTAKEAEGNNLEETGPKPPLVLRQRRSMHVAGHSSTALSVGPNYAPCVDEALLADPTQDTRHPDRECYAVYSVDQPLPRKLSRAEVEIWTEPMHREGSLEGKLLAVRITDGCAPVQLAF